MHHQQQEQSLPPSTAHVQRSPFAQSQARTPHALMQQTSQMQTNQTPVMLGPAQHPPSVQKVQAWTQQHHFGDSGVQSMTPSTAMSSAVSVMSGASSMQDEYSGPNLSELTDTQQRKFDGIPAEFTNQPFGASQNDRDPAAIANAIPDLIGLLADSDEVVVEQAAMMVRKFVKLEAKQPYNESVVQNSDLVIALWQVLKTHRRPEIVTTVLWALFHISMKTDGLEKLKQIVQLHNGQFIIELLTHLSSETAYKPALMTLHNLLQESNKQSSSSTACRVAQQANGLRSVVNLLDGNNEKFLSIAVDCARLLYRQSPEQKIRFLQAGGPMKLVNILRIYQHENLLATTTRALLPLSNCTQNARAIVEAGGIQALQLRLDHGSQRLLLSSLDCLRNLSDVPTGDTDITELLGKLLRLLGVNDGNMVLYCVWILSNMCANNKQNKEFLCQNGALISLIRVLQTASNGHYTVAVKTQPQHQAVMEEVQEGALAAIRQLCVGHDRAADVQLALLKIPGAAEIYLSRLIALRPAVLKQTLQVLNKAASQDQNLPYFRDAKTVLPNEQRDTNFCEQIICVLRVACYSIELTDVENVKVADLIWLSMSTLQHLCADEAMFRQILYFLKSPEFAAGPQRLVLPLFVLSQPQNNENVQRSALGLLNELANDQEIGTVLLRDQNYIGMFEQFANSQIQANATYAFKLLEKLTLHQQRLFGGVSARPAREEFYQPQAVWNEDQMNGAIGSDDPFANVFCQQSQLQQQRPQRLSDGSMTYDPSPLMDSMHLGSPASPWHSGTQQAPYPGPGPSGSHQFGGYQ